MPASLRYHRRHHISQYQSLHLVSKNNFLHELNIPKI
nr:MAG TPA: hypothetical protein [Caudoviricetes sp.]